MNKYQKLIALTAASAVMGFSNGAFAGNGSEQPAPPQSGLSINYYSLDSVITSIDGVNTSEVYAGMQIQMTDSFKANIAADLEAIYGSTFNGEFFDWQAAVVELNGTISIDAFGKPVIIVFGKLLEVTMKKRLAAVPASDASRLQPDELEQVIGATFALTTDHLDSLTFSATETKGGDFAVDTDVIRMTVKAEKTLNATVSVNGSLSYELNEIDGDGYAASAGAVIDVSNMVGIEGLSAYGQVTYFDNYAGYNQEIGYEIGLNYEVNDTTAVTLSAEQFSNDTLVRLGASHQFDKNWMGTGALFVKNPGKVNQSKGIELGLSKKF